MVTRHIRRWYVSGQNTHPYHSIRTPTETQVWGTNYNRLATATMFTLFFAGDRFAPNFPRLKNKKKKMLTIQQYLQSHYIDAMKRVAHEIRDLPNVLGFDTLNEPSQGWACRETPLDVNCWPAPMGWSLTGWDAIRLGSGCAISVRCVRAILIISLMYHSKSHTSSRLVLKHQLSNTGTLLLLSVQFRTHGNLESDS